MRTSTPYWAAGVLVELPDEPGGHAVTVTVGCKAPLTPKAPATQTATVLFGNTIDGLTRPGETPAHVTGFKAPDGTEKACRAIDALDGELGLSRPGTARLLILVTDASFVGHGEPAGAQPRITTSPEPAAASSSSPPKGYAAMCPFTDCQVTEPAGAIARALTTDPPPPGRSGPAPPPRPGEHPEPRNP